MTTAVSLAQSVAPGVSLGFKNRIINGAMMIDQRNAGASVAVSDATSTFITDRWSVYENSSGAFSWQQVSDAPTGFINSLKCTVTTANSSPSTSDLVQLKTTIEGLNVSDLSYGSSSAKNITLSFWVKSSLTGQFGGSVSNNARDRAYPFSYTVSSASTWEQKTVTIPGCTDSTWLTTNGVGMFLFFDLGMGSVYTAAAGSWANADYRGATGDTKVINTLNATWQITGVQLEVGTAATNFEYRDYGRELIMCQRYFQKSYDQGTVGGTATFTGFTGRNGTANGAYFTTGEIINEAKFSVTMRTAPSLSIWDGAGNASKVTRTAFGVADYNNQGTYQTQNIYDRGFSLQSGSGSNACCVSCQYYASAEL